MTEIKFQVDFARMMWMFSKLSEEAQVEFLDTLMTEQERASFLQGYGSYLVMTDHEYHDKIMAMVLRQYLQEVIKNS